MRCYTHRISYERGSTANLLHREWNSCGTVWNPKSVQAVCKHNRRRVFQKPISAIGKSEFSSRPTRVAATGTKGRTGRFTSSTAGAGTNGAWENRTGKPLPQ